MTAINQAEGAARTVDTSHQGGRSLLRFAGHVVEMTLAMTVGMTLGGPLGIPGVASVELRALLWLVVMTAPMVAWMGVRGMSTRSAAEMALAMATPTVALLPLYWAGAIAGSTLIGLEHSLMIPAMVALMIARRDHYGWAA